MLKTLAYIAEKLNKADILWGVGASMLLNYYQLIDDPNDIDIFVHPKDIEKADAILKSLGEKRPQGSSPIYATTYFYEYEIEGIDIDVMAELKINFENGTYTFDFDADAISQWLMIGQVKIPLTCLEDWYVLYQIIPNRLEKAKLIEDYLKLNGLRNPQRLSKSLEGNLPEAVRKRTIETLKINRI